MRSFGEPLDGLEYWLDAAYVRGRDSSTDIRAFGADMGATYTFDAPLTPYVTLAYAFGSGDRSTTKGTDESFRQTGLQDNDAKFGGVASFRYYGEVLDLELSNISIYTAGIGFRPTKMSSIDLVREGSHATSLNAMSCWEIQSRSLHHVLPCRVGRRSLPSGGTPPTPTHGPSP